MTRSLKVTEISMYLKQYRKLHETLRNSQPQTKQLNFSDKNNLQQATNNSKMSSSSYHNTQRLLKSIICTLKLWDKFLIKVKDKDFHN